MKEQLVSALLLVRELIKPNIIGEVIASNYTVDGNEAYIHFTVAPESTHKEDSVLDYYIYFNQDGSFDFKLYENQGVVTLCHSKSITLQDVMNQINVMIY